MPAVLKASNLEGFLVKCQLIDGVELIDLVVKIASRDSTGSSSSYRRVPYVLDFVGKDNEHNPLLRVNGKHPFINLLYNVSDTKLSKPMFRKGSQLSLLRPSLLIEYYTTICAQYCARAGFRSRVLVGDPYLSSRQKKVAFEVLPEDTCDIVVELPSKFWKLEI